MGPLHKNRISESSSVCKMLRRHHLFLWHQVPEGKKKSMGRGRRGSNPGGRGRNLSSHFAGLEGSNQGVATKAGFCWWGWPWGLGQQRLWSYLQPGCLTMETSAHSSNLFLCFHGRINSKFQGSTECLPPACVQPKNAWCHQSMPAS